jgi:uncharacterized membrane protein
MSIGLLLLLLVCPLAMILMMRGMGQSHDEHSGPAAPTPLELLQARFARGEITKDEFEQARETLTRGPGSPVA